MTGPLSYTNLRENRLWRPPVFLKEKIPHAIQPDQTATSLPPYEWATGEQPQGIEDFSALSITYLQE